MSQQGKRKTKFSGLLYITKNWKYSCILYAHSQFLCRKVANLAFLKPDFEILAFSEQLWLFLEIKNVRKIWLGSGKTLSELHIHYKSLATRVYYHAGSTEYCKIFSIVLKMIYVIDKKQMHDSVITGKEYSCSSARIRRDISASFWSCKLLWRSDECVLLPFFDKQPKFCSYELVSQHWVYFPPIS